MGSAAGLALGASFDWEKALWVPGEKTIFLPPAPTSLPLPFPCRLQYGIVTFRPELAVRLTADDGVWKAQEEVNQLSNVNTIHLAVKRMAERIDKDILTLYNTDVKFLAGAQWPNV